MKIILLGLLLVLGLPGCSQKTESPTAAVSNQFSISAGDVARTSIEDFSVSGSTSPTRPRATLHVELTGAKAAEFRKFTREHLQGKIQILVGPEVVQETTVVSEVVGPRIDLLFVTRSEAQSVADLLSKK